MSDINIKENLRQIRNGIPENVTLIAVSKFHPEEDVMQAYEAGQRHFGENHAQEVTRKYNNLPKDIVWHFIGHLQTNKVKYIAPYIYMIHSVDSMKLLSEINKEARKNDRVIKCLLQMHIANEETKFGFTPDECISMLESINMADFPNVCICGVMGMATNTDDEEEVAHEFRNLHNVFLSLKEKFFKDSPDFKEISMGMSGDYHIAIQEGSTMVRIGSNIFGERIYNK